METNAVGEVTARLRILEINMALSEQSERFVLACFEDGGGQGFDWWAAAEGIGLTRPEADALAREIAGAGLFQPVSPGGEGTFTAEGRAFARELLKGKAKQPGYWTKPQREFLRIAFEVAGRNNSPFNKGAVVKGAGLSPQAADGTRAQLIQRGILADAGMRTFTPDGLKLVSDHFAGAGDAIR